MKTKKARYIVQAIQSWCKTYKEIIEYVQREWKLWFISDVYIKYLCNCLEIWGYTKGVKVDRYLTRSMLREVSGQIDIKL